MRIKGNIYPETVTVETYLSMPGMVEIRLRENVMQLDETLYEYDEYTKIMPDRPGLREDISANLSDWLTTLRTLEVSENASIVADQRRDINAYEQALTEIETALGVSG